MIARHKGLLAAMLSVALAFAVAIPLGLSLRPSLPTIPDQLYGVIILLILVAIAAGTMRLLRGRLWMPAPIAREPGRDAVITGYELTFNDFSRLVSDPYCRPVIAPLLKEWYGYELVGQRTGTVVRSPDGQPVGLRHLHNRIQIDPPKQYTLYQRAMDLWR